MGSENITPCDVAIPFQILSGTGSGKRVDLRVEILLRLMLKVWIATKAIILMCWLIMINDDRIIKV
jgi:hypothetical protein